MAKLTRKELERHDCRAAGVHSWWAKDGCGIPLARVCDLCEKAKLAK